MYCKGPRLEVVGDSAMWKTDVKSSMEDRKQQNILLWRIKMINPRRDKAKKRP